MKREAIAVFNPSNELERAIQEASKNFLGNWLSMYQCKLMAKAISSLKYLDEEWVDDANLLLHRVNYFFKDQFTEDHSEMIFVTHLLFLRDILENKEINSYIHSPVVFLSSMLANYFFREYPIHILIDVDILRSENPKVKFFDIGGCIIVDGEDVIVDSSIKSIDCKENKSMKMEVDPAEISNMQFQMKAAASLVDKGVFKIDEHERALLPDTDVWDKERRTQATIYMVQPGETGEVGVKYSDGFELTIPKNFFDSRFLVI
ncbi:hypothetical protein LCGC14_1250880 [marine sediment metagenome]|uniref:Uncharacterized protein n=1 Tax=marine sediment metagenome TaxID=412755 RepID=A0A0F9L6T7_9ZZZZ